MVVASSLLCGSWRPRISGEAQGPVVITARLTTLAFEGWNPVVERKKPLHTVFFIPDASGRLHSNAMFQCMSISSHRIFVSLRRLWISRLVTNDRYH